MLREQHAPLRATEDLPQLRHRPVRDKSIEEAYHEVVLKAVPKIPYPTKTGLQTLINFMVKTTPELANAKPEDFIDSHFIKELEDSGFYTKLYR